MWFSSHLILTSYKMFEPFVIIEYESLSCSLCEKMDLKTTQSVTAGKALNMQNMLENQRICKRISKELLRTNKGLINNHHKTSQPSWIMQATTQYEESIQKLLNRGIFINSAFFFLSF